MKRYPVAYFAWDRVKGSFIGNSPITALKENQKYINKAYAMVMKHMTDTAFSKIVYDKTLIPEWTNEVGEAIGVRGGGDVRLFPGGLLREFEFALRRLAELFQRAFRADLVGDCLIQCGGARFELGDACGIGAGSCPHPEEDDECAENQTGGAADDCVKDHTERCSIMKGN